MNKVVKFFNPGREFELHQEEYTKAWLDVRKRGDIILRKDLEEFESNFAKYVGTKYAVGLNSGTDALLIALKAIGIKEGDEVITSSHTFVATVQVIVQCGATPILVDIGSDGLIDMDEVERKITEKTKVIMPVHIVGVMCNMKRLNDIINDRDIYIIEDQAQALGAK